MTRTLLLDDNSLAVISFINKTYDSYGMGKGLMPDWQKLMMKDIELKYYKEVFENNNKYRQLIKDMIDNNSVLLSQRLEQLSNRVFDNDHPRYICIIPDSPHDNYEVRVDMLTAYVYFIQK